MSDADGPKRNGLGKAILVKFVFGVLALVVLGYIFYSIFGISTGTPYVVFSRFGSNDIGNTAAFNAYGPGAYDVSSTLYLMNLGIGVPLVVLLIAALFGAKSATKVIFKIGTVIAGASTIAVVIWLSVDWATGVPPSNYEFVSNVATAYLSSYTLPVVFLALAVYFVIPKKPRSARDREIAAHEIKQ